MKILVALSPLLACGVGGATSVALQGMMGTKALLTGATDVSLGVAEADRFQMQRTNDQMVLERRY